LTFQTHCVILIYMNDAKNKTKEIKMENIQHFNLYARYYGNLKKPFKHLPKFMLNGLKHSEKIELKIELKNEFDRQKIIRDERFCRTKTDYKLTRKMIFDEKKLERERSNMLAIERRWAALNNFGFSKWNRN